MHLIRTLCSHRGWRSSITRAGMMVCGHGPDGRHGARARAGPGASREWDGRTCVVPSYQSKGKQRMWRQPAGRVSHTVRVGWCSGSEPEACIIVPFSQSACRSVSCGGVFT